MSADNSFVSAIAIDPKDYSAVELFHKNKLIARIHGPYRSPREILVKSFSIVFDKTTQTVCVDSLNALLKEFYA